MSANISLQTLQKQLEAHYLLYTLGKITVKEYLALAKPIDMAIGEMEMATLQCTVALNKPYAPRI